MGEDLGTRAGRAAAYEVRALGIDTWEPFAALVERHRGVWGGCWCTSFHTMSHERTGTAEGNRALKEQLVREGRTHAALVLHEGEAVAWCQYGAPAELPNIKHRRAYLADAPPPADWRITCFFVDSRHRRHGLAAVALRGAVDLVARAGGGVVESFPQDTDGARVSGSFLHNGTLAMFEQEGFEVVRRLGKNHTVVRRTVPARAPGRAGS